MGCRESTIKRWTFGMADNASLAMADELAIMPNIFPSLLGYLVVNVRSKTFAAFFYLILLLEVEVEG